MTSVTSPLSSILYAQYGAQTGVTMVKTLLQGVDNPGFSLINNTIGAGNINGDTAGLGMIENFIKDNVPNPEKLLKDLAAVSALTTMIADEDISSSTAAFISPFFKSLYFSDDYLLLNPNYQLSLLV